MRLCFNAFSDPCHANRCFKTLLARNYRGDIPMSAVEKFPVLLSDAEEESSAVPPCFSDEGINVCRPETRLLLVKDSIERHNSIFTFVTTIYTYSLSRNAIPMLQKSYCSYTRSSKSLQNTSKSWKRRASGITLSSFTNYLTR